MRRRLAFGLGLLALSIQPCLPVHGAELRLELAGPLSVVYDSVRNACDPIDVPDMNPRVFRDADDGITMFALHFINRPLRGADFDHLKIDCHVALNSRLDPDPSHFDDRSYLAAVWTNDGHSVSALVHHEYHADQHGRCRATGDIPCWYNSILSYQSTDGGETFAKDAPFIVASAPFTQDVGQGRHRGFFAPSNIVADGDYRYVMLSTTGWDGQAPGNCLFRTADPTDSAAWRAYDGTGFTIQYANPYTSSAQPRPCKPIEPFLFPVGSLSRHVASGLWVAVFQAPITSTFPVEGFYYATGRDLLHWSKPKLLIAGKTIYSDLCKAGASIINYPSLIDPDAKGRNFDTTGDHPSLFFATIQVVGCQTAARMLVRQPLLFERTDKP